MRSVQLFCVYVIHKQVFDNSAFLHKPPSHIGLKGHHHLVVAINDLLVIALAIECKKCHLPTNNMNAITYQVLSSGVFVVSAGHVGGTFMCCV